MDNLILQMGGVNISSEVYENYERLLNYKLMIEDTLENCESNEQLLEFYNCIDEFNQEIRNNVSFDLELYNTSDILQNVIKLCDIYYSASLHGSIRHRLVQTLNFYNNIIICIGI